MFGLVPFAMLPRPVKGLLVANAVVFGSAFLAQLLGMYGLLGWLDWLVLIPERLPEAWRLVTYAFVHVSPMHFLFNMLMLWMFGVEVVQWMGERPFWALYFSGAVVSGLLSAPFYASHLIGGGTTIIGASGALFAVMVAYARFFPDRRILVFFVFPMKIRTAIWLFILIDLLMSRSGDGIAHFTHLGGAFAGWAFMALRDRWGREHLTQWFHGIGGSGSRKKSNSVLEGELGNVNDELDLDRILKKISRSGVQSLSPSEVEKLQKASQRRRGPRRPW